MSDYKLICTDCGREYKKDDVEYVCPECAKGQKPMQPTLGVLKVEYDYEEILSSLRRVCRQAGRQGSKMHVLDSGFRRNDKDSGNDKGKHRGNDKDGLLAMLLPLDSFSSLPPLQVGPTPLEKVERVRAKLGLKNLYIKNDTVLPTGSFKDRASSVVVAKARELKKDIITTASTGNAATALAGMCASVGQKSVIFVPAAAPKAKLTQIAMFGARLIPVNGVYDDAFELSKQATKKFGWYNRNTGFNPYTVEGKKTAALEIWEQLGFKAPDKVLIPTGDGVILSGTYKGFYDLKKLGLIDKIPQMIPVQAEGSAAIVDPLQRGENFITTLSKCATIADSISVSAPACGRWALKIVRETEGFGIKVSDEEILAAEKELAGLAGIFAEPAAATAYAGLVKLVKNSPSPCPSPQGGEGCALHPDETIVVLVTGTGLKDIPAAMKVIDIPEPIELDINAVKIS